MTLVKISCIVLMAFVLVGCSNKGEKLALTLENGYYPKTSDVYIEASPAMREFLDMQNEITETLRVKDNRYIYIVGKVLRKLLRTLIFLRLI